MSAFTVANDVWGDDSPNVGASGAPGPFIAFYAMTGQNYPVPPLPEFDPLDIAYVGTVMLEVAGLPLSATQHERKRLMMDCGGRYFGCEPRSQILAFHRRLINSGFRHLHNQPIALIIPGKHAFGVSPWGVSSDEGCGAALRLVYRCASGQAGFGKLNGLR